MAHILNFIAAFIRKPQSAVKLTAVLLILGLCFGLWVQTQRIGSLNAENQAQAQSIEQLNRFNEQVNKQLKAEQQAVLEQQKLTSELRAKVEQAKNDVKTHLQQEPCANTALPRAVVDSL
ncbi:DUF2570 domain-containing protein, partial [[Haemophilus] felis]|nr:DUF2570 domain-containing protein [[Haemophilus] felis]